MALLRSLTFSAPSGADHSETLYMAVPAFWRRLPIDTYMLLLLGTLLIAVLLPARGVVAQSMDYLTTAAVALLFFLYGARIAPKAILDGMLHWRLQGLVLLCTFVLFPIIGLLITLIFRPVLTPDLAFGLLFVALLPSTVQSSIAFTAIARGNVPAALCSASVSNLLGVVITPALVALLLASTHGSGLGFDSIRDIAIQLLLPFALGQLARPLIGKWLGNHKRLTMFVDRGSILLIVYAAFSEGMVAGVWTQLGWPSLLLVVALDSLLLAVILILTTIVSRWLKFSKEDEITVVFCGSKKSMATGIPMANILFAGQAIALIVLPLMIFHQIQLFVCATIARHYANRPVTGPV